MIARLILSAGVDRAALPLLTARALRAFVDGYVAVLLPAYLLALGFGVWEVGLISTATLLGSALATLAVGAWGHRFHHRHLLLAAALLMAATGLGFASLSAFWPLLLVAFAGTLNPSSGDVSVFLPLEHARLAEAAQGDARTALFARYSLPVRCAPRWARWPPPCRTGWWRVSPSTGSTLCAACSLFTRSSVLRCGYSTRDCRSRSLTSSPRRQPPWGRRAGS